MSSVFGRKAVEGKIMRNSRILCAAAALAVAGITRTVLATPYASEVTAGSGNVSFYLNENATDVTVVRDGVSQDLGGMGSGQQSFALNGATNYQIVVSNQGPSGYNTFAAAPNFSGGTLAAGATDTFATLSGVSGARSVAINQDPKSPFFGRVYLAQGGTGTSYTNPDLSNQVPNNGGFAYAGSNSPYRLTIGPDDNVYISDWTDAQSGVFVQDPNLNNNQQVLTGVGDTTAVNVHGSIVSQVSSVTGTPGNVRFREFRHWMRIWCLSVDIFSPVPTVAIPRGTARQVPPTKACGSGT